jgi:O-antigen ligase
MRLPRAKSIFASPPEHVVAVLYGLLDSSVWIASYGFSSNGGLFSLYYMFAAPCKVAILLVFMRTARPARATLLWPFCLPICVTILASVLMGYADFDGVLQPAGVLVSLALTVMVLSDRNVGLYMKAFGLSCLLACATFLFQVNLVPLNSLNGVWEASGRYTFIFGTQPNLGGEVLVSGFIALCVARVNTALLIAIFLLFFASLNLLESRAAMLSMLLAFSLYIYAEKLRLFSSGSRIAVVVALLLIIAILLVFNTDRISSLFLLDDPHRGVGTGYVGREDRWENAWNVFTQSPIFGVGFSYFRAYGSLTPHSMWLGMLSVMGLMSVFLVISMVRSGWRVYRINTTLFLLIISFFPMTVFNDRLLNLNPYPFLLFVLLFLPRKALAASVQAGALREHFDASALTSKRVKSLRAAGLMGRQLQ